MENWEMDKRDFATRCRGAETNTRLVIGLRFIALWFAAIDAQPS
jgi:hypothetical protein